MTKTKGSLGRTQTKKAVEAEDSASAPRSAEVPSEEGSSQAYARFEARARALPVDALIQLDVDPTLARSNALRGAAVVFAAREAVVNTGMKVDWQAIGDLDALGLALLWATAETRPVPPAALVPKIKQAWRLRRKLLKAVDALVAWELVTASERAEIVKGSGPIDTARDLLALARLFRRDAAVIVGKHPVTDEALAEAESLGTELVRALKPSRAKVVSARKSTDAARMEDRMYTLLHRAYSEVERAAGALWGRDAATQVPSLRSRTRQKSATKVVVADKP